ncbi:MAG TPA: hypothetical protein VFT82_01040 [Candidatus Paceibacterota bacterium]|nr:hypothetical protein [Candidatus Paceibacterota bacterium]
MNLQDLTIDQKEWAAKNPTLVRTIIANAADHAMAEARSRERRREELLTPVCSFTYPGRSEPFSFVDNFSDKGIALVAARVFYVSPSFKEWFFPKIELGAPKAELVVSKVYPGSNDSPYATEPEIRERLGESAEVRLAHACYVLEKAWLNAYRIYCFHVKDAKGILRSVSAERYEKGWSICAAQIGYHDELRNGIRVVSLPF